ncbi:MULTISPECIES: Cmx/CmrA family chloramphenicol efflux MFS transporter [unclassified Streptomyces]|uniref:Cmx/CmrA family chloramphenicol efflux MFS transporter n=1 Tax=unclassified Streptomyces TaxID=2593676 RepID=UPI0001C189FB|nr:MULTISPECIES: Cmx/CmrA family chloramphenicol efflux MFS transporter [unclassified Streptomyces]AEN09596.1 major facilitator superfamily MFS_1 [Streptomyces sp. SirexAA-E]MYR70160.1 Cmx/CmrA family chloramphenicol efflux MFS transporter [Streptomyces sp. SID4939]MYS04472.1 Cmx/CmrA family chloramphenicol efflux MFS transporter [Streptomyces sp. SID4940]MYT64544.1 Cmx/CmrA family chloramphenicol efflux MFS transporter [Streptomyces sp. SID8357]MYT87357.1 Cmx/CmrA family chloramphenicol efflu
MPFAVYVLGLAVFAQGTSEFMLSGLLTGIAGDLHVPLSAAGLLTSAFAVGMVVGAPLTALAGRTWPRRRALLFFLGVFVAVHVAGALTGSYGVLLATRVAGALANAGFWAVALVTAVDLAGPRRRARATAVVVGGVTVACVVGVPAGAVLGELWGWRAAFWAVALVSLPAALALLRAVPGGRPGDVPLLSARTELRALARPRLLLTLLVMALVQGATFCTFSYLEPLVTRVTGVGAGWVPAVLALFGAGSFAGVTLAGRLADTHPRAVAGLGMAALTAGWAALALTAAHPVAVLALVLLQGALAFGTGTALITRVLQQAPDAPTLAGSFATAAFNVGAATGPWLGGLTLGTSLGFRAPVWVSALLMVLALAVAALLAREPATVRVHALPGVDET